ncbi:restriction endonuclease PLD domain-containing protein [Ruminiclostridium cellobioparum]|uniref:restriction endonuclease PLD domain-containing protein n=1 Tax=Ruminiclostridium cellobioparum TaxID=29355 RepID=UPI0028AEC96E|nr:restriction endonuclease PLD domain-containing protein [Ruminiclostridium cellobioparum]
MIIGDKKVFNEAVSLYEKLESELLKGSWNSITLCSAFLTESAAQSIIELFDAIKTRRKIKFTIIVGIKNYFTVPEAIRLLIDYIENNNKSNFEFNLMLPKDNDFHMKCNVFLGRNSGKALIGSANLTETGLESKGELMVEVDNQHTIDSVVSYIDRYLNESEYWQEYIDKYEMIYENTKPDIKKDNTNGLFKKQRILKPKQKKTIRFTAPTMDALGTVSEEQEERVIEIFDSVKEQHTDINKSNWILFYDQTEADNDTIREKYLIGSCFDRPKDNNKTWEIGTNRIICNVGAIVNTQDDELVMFMKKGCIHYRVTEEFILTAERLGIKSDDEEHIPTKEEMDKYKRFVLNNRSK